MLQTGERFCPALRPQHPKPSTRLLRLLPLALPSPPRRSGAFPLRLCIAARQEESNPRILRKRREHHAPCPLLNQSDRALRF